MKDFIISILKMHHYKPEEIAKLIDYHEAEDKPEDFNPADFVKSHLETQKEIIISKAKSSIEEAAKKSQGSETYIATLKPIIAQVAQILGKSKDEVKNLIIGEGAKLKPRDLVKIVAEHVEANTKPDDSAENEYKTKFETLQAKYFEEKEEWEGSEVELRNLIEAEKNNVVTFKKNFHRDRLLRELLNDEENIKWAYPDQKRNNMELVTADLLREYNLEPTEDNKSLKILSKDGGIATSRDGNRKYENALEAAVDIIKERRMWKQSNGGGNPGDPLPNGKTKTVEGKEVAMEGYNAMAEHLKKRKSNVIFG